MAEEFEFQDLSDAVFWGVDLRRATFRDVDLQGARITHARLVDVVVDAEIDALVVNGVDVTAYVNARDPWYPLRSQLRPTTAESMRAGWPVLVAAWEDAIDRAAALPDAQRHASVGGEWSFVETLRHLVFATDKWFGVPVLGGDFAAVGLPNSGSVDFGWPGIDMAAAPTFDDAVTVWRDRAQQLSDYLDDLDDGDDGDDGGPAVLGRTVEVLENGASSVRDCVGVVFEEHFEHLRYATRDLDLLG